MSGQATPLFSIITVVFNGEKLLPGTAESVFKQTFTNYEYLIVDGASRDGTMEYVRNLEPKMPNLRWLSERDNGLYDAMNKGLHLAKGEFVLFLNAGDHLHAPDTLEKLAALVGPETGVLYGETQLVYENRESAGVMSELSTRNLPQTLSWKDYLGGMLVVHQSFVARRSLASDYRTDNLCADFDWCIGILKKSRENRYAGFIISDYLMGGMSKQRHRQSLIDRFKVMEKHYGFGQALWAHVKIVGRAGKHYFMRWGKKRY
ncbi:MAG: glycosyltransferase [Saprospiraceae bacterium]|nr:glycosyltransferase [Saprospiraceae bacterium]